MAECSTCWMKEQQLREIIRRRDETQAEVERQALELETARLRVHNLTAERNGWRARAEGAEGKLTEQYDILSGRYNALGAERDALKAEVERLRQDGERIAYLERAREMKIAEIDRLRVEIEERYSLNVHQAEQVARLQRELAVMTAARDGLAYDMRKAAAHNVRLERDLTNCVALLEQARAEGVDNA